jgi:hypothetical protein
MHIAVSLSPEFRSGKFELSSNYGLTTPFRLTQPPLKKR